RNVSVKATATLGAEASRVRRRPRRVLLRPGDGALLLFAEAFHAEPDDAARLEVRRRLLAHADAGRRAGGNDVARLQAHELAQVAHEVRHAEDHRARRAVLVALAVDLEPEVELVPVRHFVGRDEPRTDRAERIGALTLDPLAAHFQLEGALRHVVHDAVAGDVIERLGLRHVAGRPADDDAELDLPVGLLGAARDDDVVVGPRDGRRRLHEDDRLGRHGHARLGRVVRVVQTDADELADPADARADARRIGNL